MTRQDDLKYTPLKVFMGKLAHYYFNESFKGR